jgi:hypothetical protein
MVTYPRDSLVAPDRAALIREPLKRANDLPDLAAKGIDWGGGHSETLDASPGHRRSDTALTPFSAEGAGNRREQ